MLRGKLVTLKPIEEASSDKLYEWINSPNIVRLSGPYKPISYRQHIEWMKNITTDPTAVAFEIHSNGSDGLVGVVQLVGVHPVHRNAEMRIRIGEECARGKGYGAETLRLLLKFAFNDLNLHRVYCTVFHDNWPAIKCYEVCGFKAEGQLQEAAYIDGEWKNIVLMGVVKSER